MFPMVSNPSVKVNLLYSSFQVSSVQYIMLLCLILPILLQRLHQRIEYDPIEYHVTLQSKVKVNQGIVRSKSYMYDFFAQLRNFVQLLAIESRYLVMWSNIGIKQYVGLKLSQAYYLQKLHVYPSFSFKQRKLDFQWQLVCFWHVTTNLIILWNKPICFANISCFKSKFQVH